MSTAREMVKTVSAPDGWAWDDIYLDPIKSFGVGGWLSGIAMQRGEPILEQDGHFLIVRQGETSFEPRQDAIYRRLSRQKTHDDSGFLQYTTTVLVVLGFKGARSGFVVYSEGERSDRVSEPGPEPIRDFIVHWFTLANSQKITPREIHREEKPDQMEIS